MERNYLLSVPELDHYPRDACSTRHWGVLANVRVGESPRWADQPGPKVFAYLRPNLEGLEQVLTALAAMPASVLLRIAGVEPQWRTRFPQFAWRDALQRKFHAGQHIGGRRRLDRLQHAVTFEQHRIRVGAAHIDTDPAPHGICPPGAGSSKTLTKSRS